MASIDYGRVQMIRYKVWQNYEKFIKDGILTFSAQMPYKVIWIMQDIKNIAVFKQIKHSI